MTTISTKSWLIVGAIALATATGAGVAMTGDPDPDHEPNLCELDEGAWCEPCGDQGKGEPECPAGASGWLCCSMNTGQRVCVVSGLIDCSGPGQTPGWCANYTEDPVTGVATCHD